MGTWWAQDQLPRAGSQRHALRPVVPPGWLHAVSWQQCAQLYGIDTQQPAPMLSAQHQVVGRDCVLQPSGSSAVVGNVTVAVAEALGCKVAVMQSLAFCFGGTGAVVGYIRMFDCCCCYTSHSVACDKHLCATACPDAETAPYQDTPVGQVCAQSTSCPCIHYKAAVPCIIHFQNPSLHNLLGSVGTTRNCTVNNTTIGCAPQRLKNHTHNPILPLLACTACIACCQLHNAIHTLHNVQLHDTLLFTNTQLCGFTDHTTTSAPTKHRKHHDPHCANYLTELAALSHQGRGSSHQPATQTPIRRTRLYGSRPSSTQPRGGWRGIRSCCRTHCSPCTS
jgi:hypothetical protein